MRGPERRGNLMNIGSVTRLLRFARNDKWAVFGLFARPSSVVDEMIEQHFDIPFVADLALREKQIQQNYRPIIAVHKWFARNPIGTLSLNAPMSDSPR